MPIADMAKVTIFAPYENAQVVVDRLHELEAVHVTDLAPYVEDNDELGEKCAPIRPEPRELRLALSRTDFLIELLQRIEGRKKGIISGFLKERQHLTYEEFMAIEKEIQLEEVYKELEKLDVELRHAEGLIGEMKKELEVLRPWQALEPPLSELGAPGTVVARPVIAGIGQLTPWVEEMESQCPAFAWEEVHRDGSDSFVLVLVHKDDVGGFESLAQRFSLEQVQFGSKAGTVKQEMEILQDTINEETSREEGIVEEIKARLSLKPKLLVLNDYLFNQLLKEEAKGNFVHTERVVVVNGWVEKSRIEEVSEGLKQLGDDVDVSFDGPGEDETAPILLRNRKSLLPVEGLVRLFGLPHEHETDPTWIMAPFFVLFFGLCMADVGYGIILTVACWWMLKKLDVTDSVKYFIRLFMYGGVATIVGGILTRGYFGIETGVLPRFLQFKGTFDTLGNPVPFMIFCAALGLLHISTGQFIEMRDNARENSWWLAFCEQGTTLILWLGLGIILLGWIGLGSGASGWSGLYIMAAGAAGVVLLSNIASEKVMGKFFGGLLNLYGLFGGTIGDVASYLRLYALGLATVAVGFVVNEMAVMMLKIPILGILLMLVVLLVGHSFNLLINLLGAFVHPLRLQYVEFFGKFYEDGGEHFTPLALQERNTAVHRP